MVWTRGVIFGRFNSMEWLAEFIGTLSLNVLLNGLFYPFGVLRFWIIGKYKKSFKKIIEENSFQGIALQGRIFMLDLVAGVGALGLTAMLIFSTRLILKPY
jgi:hypothetical protein